MAVRRGWARGWGLWGAASLSLSCLPTLPPAWLVEEVTILAIRTEVVEAGPLARPLSEDPPDRTRSEAMPGDRVRLRPIAADAEGLVDVGALAPIWLRCTEGCLGDLADLAASGEALEACEAAPRRRICRAGEGAPLEVEVDSRWRIFERGPSVIRLGVPFLMVAGAPGGPGSATCLERAQALPRGDLSGCLLVQRGLAIGPIAAEEEAAEEGEPAALVPNLNPEIARFVVTIDGAMGEAASGERLRVRPGQRVEVAAIVLERDLQTYEVLPGLEFVEAMIGTWYATAPIFEGAARIRDPALRQAWTVDAGLAGSDFDVHVVVREGGQDGGLLRGSASHGWLRWRVEGGDGG